MKKSTKHGTLTKLLGRKHSPPSLFTPTPMGVTPLNSGAADMQSFDTGLTDSFYVGGRQSTSIDSGTARVKFRPTVKLFPQTPTNNTLEPQGLNVPTPSIPDGFRNYNTTTSQERVNDMKMNGNLKSPGASFNQNVFMPTYTEDIFIPPPPPMQPPPPPPQMVPPPPPPPPPPPMDPPTPPSFSPPRPPSMLSINQQPVVPPTPPVLLVYPQPMASPAPPGKPKLGIPTFPKATPGLNFETTASTWRPSDAQLPSPSHYLTPPKFNPPPPPPKAPSPLPSQSTLSRTPKVPPPKPVRYSSMQNLDRLTEPSYQTPQPDTLSLYEADLQQPHGKSLVPSSFNPKTEAKLYIPSESERKAISDRQGKAKSMIIMEDFSVEGYATNIKHAVDLNRDGTRVTSGTSEAVRVSSDLSKPQKPVRKNGPQYQTQNRIGSKETVDLSSYSHSRSTDVWDNRSSTTEYIPHFKHQNQPYKSSTSKNELQSPADAISTIGLGTESKEQQLDKSKTIVNFNRDTKDSPGLVIPTPPAQLAGYRSTNVKGSSVNASTVSNNTLSTSIPETADLNNTNDTIELIHPITGAKLDPQSPMALLLAAKYRTLKEANAPPQNQSSLDMPSLGQSESSSVNFHYSESKPNSVIIIPKPQQKDNLSFASETHLNGPMRKNDTYISKTPEPERKNINNSEFSENPDINRVSLNSNSKLDNTQPSPKTEKLSASQLIQSLLSKQYSSSIAQENVNNTSGGTLTSRETTSFSFAPPSHVFCRDEDSGEEFTFEPIPPPPEFSGDDTEHSMPFPSTDKGHDDAVLMNKSIVSKEANKKQQDFQEPSYLNAKHFDSKRRTTDSNPNEISSPSIYNKKPLDSNPLQSSANYTDERNSVMTRLPSTTQYVSTKDYGKGSASWKFSPSPVSPTSTSVTDQQNRSVPKLKSSDSKPSHQHTQASVSSEMKSKDQNTNTPSSKESQRPQQSKSQQTIGRTFIVRPGTKQPITVLEPGNPR